MPIALVFIYISYSLIKFNYRKNSNLCTICGKQLNKDKSLELTRHVGIHTIEEKICSECAKSPPKKSKLFLTLHVILFIAFVISMIYIRSQ